MLCQGAYEYSAFPDFSFAFFFLLYLTSAYKIPGLGFFFSYLQQLINSFRMDKRFLCSTIKINFQTFSQIFSNVGSGYYNTVSYA